MSAQATRSLGTPGLVIFGLVLVQPIAPVPLFGLASQMTKGHATLCLLCAMAAMALTALSYGRMGTAHPVAGSAYTYASRELHPSVGFLTGWAMGLDYLLIPVLSALYAALTMARLFPWLPMPLALTLFTACLTVLNLAGPKVSFRANVILLSLMFVALAVFFCAAILFVNQTRGWQALVEPSALFNVKTFSGTALWHGTSLVALTYLGFDGVSTLADEARDPGVTIPRATLLVVLITGLLGALELHVAHVVWPSFTTFPDADTAFLDVAARVGGGTIMGLISATLLVASAGTFLSAQASAARLLLAMGKDGALPRRPFATQRKTTGVPHLNVMLVGAFVALGGLALRFDQAAELVNFGAFTAFLAVNAAAFRHALGVRQTFAAAQSALGFLFCFAIAIGLSPMAKTTGALWLALGAIFAYRRVGRTENRAGRRLVCKEEQD